MNFKNLKIGSKLWLGFGGVALILVLTVLFTIVRMSHSRDITKRVTDIAVPSALGTESLLVGINASLAALRGYMLLGQDRLKEQRAVAWEGTINPALDRLQLLSQKWASPEDKELLQKGREKIASIRKGQDAIEAICQSEDNRPDMKILLHEAAPKAEVMVKAVTEMIDVEFEQPATAQRKALLGNLADVRGTLAMAAANLRAFLLSGEEKYQKNANELWLKNEKRYADLEQKVPLLTSKQAQAFFTFKQAREGYAQLQTKIMVIRAGEDWNKANSMLKDAAALASETKEILEKLKNSQAKIMSEDANALKGLVVSLNLMLWILLAVGLGMSAFVAYSITRSITIPVKEMVRNASDVAEGNIQDNISIDRNDEIGQLAKFLKKMILTLQHKSMVAEQIAEGNLVVVVTLASERDALGKSMEKILDNLNELLGQVQTATEQIASGSQQISDSSQALSQGATEQASSLEQITSSLTQIASQTRQNAENASQANQLAVAARGNAEGGNRQMQEMVSAMRKIEDSSKNISKIIKVIDEIAFQTNLLALNAAVEAARAGVHGKGFAVVAEEVRNLAARSAKAAKETTDLIEDSIRKVNDGTSIAKETSQALENIVLGIAKTTDLVSEIAAASNEQAQGISQVNIGLGQLNQVTQQNTSSAEGSAAASEEMSSMANQLRELVRHFKLRNQPATAPQRKAPVAFRQSAALLPAKAGQGPAPQPYKARPSGRDWVQSGAADGKNVSGPAPVRISLDDKEFGKY